MSVVEKVFVPLHCHLALIGSFGRHNWKRFRLSVPMNLDNSFCTMDKRNAPSWLDYIRPVYRYQERELFLSMCKGSREPIGYDKLI